MTGADSGCRKGGSGIESVRSISATEGKDIILAESGEGCSDPCAPCDVAESSGLPGVSGFRESLLCQVFPEIQTHILSLLQLLSPLPILDRLSVTACSPFVLSVVVKWPQEL